MSVHVQNTKITTKKIKEMVAAGEKITELTSYDFTLARLVDEAGIEMFLVGDSASTISPETERAAPAKIAVMALGRRRLRRICACKLSPSIIR